MLEPEHATQTTAGAEGGTVLSVVSVSKSYRERRALVGASLSIRRGAIHAIVGPNGAGKSTLIRILNDLEAADSGQVHRAPSLRIGYQPQTPVLYEYLRVHEFLDLAARLGRPGQTTVESVIAGWQLKGAATQLIRTLSTGTRMKVAIAAVMVQHPDLFIFDEPTNGLDPIGIAYLRDSLIGAKTSRGAVFMATHTLSFAADLCDDLTVIDQGTIRYSGPVKEFGDSAASLERNVLSLIDRRG